MAKIVGMAAPDAFVEEVNKVVKETAAKFVVPMSVDALRAYYLGSRFMVELDIVVPAKTTVTDSHELAQAILDAARAALCPPRPRPARPGTGAQPFCGGSQGEDMEDVERSLVHVDHQFRSEQRHKARRPLGVGPGSSAASSLPRRRP